MARSGVRRVAANFVGLSYQFSGMRSVGITHVRHHASREMRILLSRFQRSLLVTDLGIGIKRYTESEGYLLRLLRRTESAFGGLPRRRGAPSVFPRRAEVVALLPLLFFGVGSFSSDSSSSSSVSSSAVVLSSSSPSSASSMVSSPSPSVSPSFPLSSPSSSS